jgi:hypothetical protein
VWWWLVKRRHMHVGAPDNRIEAIYKENVLTPRGKRHEPGTWTRWSPSHRKEAIISVRPKATRILKLLERKRGSYIPTNNDILSGHFRTNLGGAFNSLSVHERSNRGDTLCSILTNQMVKYN